MSDGDRIESYARALSTIAGAEGDARRVEEELFQLARAYETSDDLRSTLTDAHVPVERRAQIVTDVLGGNAAPTTVALASMVVGNGRSRDLPAIVDAMVKTGATSRSHVVAEVRSAVALTDDQKQRLAAALSQRTGNDIEIKAIVDPSVKGGVVAQIGDEVIDGTVRARLSKLRESFA